MNLWNKFNLLFLIIIRDPQHEHRSELRERHFGNCCSNLVLWLCFYSPSVILLSFNGLHHLLMLISLLQKVKLQNHITSQTCWRSLFRLLPQTGSLFKIIHYMTQSNILSFPGNILPEEQNLKWSTRPIFHGASPFAWRDNIPIICPLCLKG